MATYITDAELLAVLAPRLGATADRLTDESFWPSIVADANLSAYQLIRSVLTGRGYSTAQIDGWERAAEFNRRIGLCHALTEGSLTQEFNTAALDRICACEKELDTVVLIIDSEPDTTAARATVSRGDMGSCGDVFKMTDQW